MGWQARPSDQSKDTYSWDIDHSVVNKVGKGSHCCELLHQACEPFTRQNSPVFVTKLLPLMAAIKEMAAVDPR